MKLKVNESLNYNLFFFRKRMESDTPLLNIPTLSKIHKIGRKNKKLSRNK